MEITRWDQGMHPLPCPADYIEYLESLGYTPREIEYILSAEDADKERGGQHNRGEVQRKQSTG